MDEKNITSFAKILRDNGDKILNSKLVLTLSDYQLCALNDSFKLIDLEITNDETELCSSTCFHVIKSNNNDQSQLYQDIQLIYDFMQKTTLLCINKSDDNLNKVDIKNFCCLKRLELKKINIKRISGIECLHNQIEHLICTRCLQSIDDIILYCKNDNSNDIYWKQLRIANFSYNNLQTINNSFEFTKLLQNLNLSHNHLKNCDAIKCLSHLQILDLSFNNLRNIPKLHADALKSLRVLVINNNFIDELSGISRIESLNTLDLSENCILDHVNLLPLSTLINLQGLNLSGNPLSCHRKHRYATAEYLNKNTTNVKFILDSEILTKYEKSLAGRYESYRTALTSNLTVPSTQKYSENKPSTSSDNTNNNEIDQLATTSEVIDPMTAFIKSLKNKKLKVRAVEIKDEIVPKEKMVGEEIENLRTKYKTEWLQSENAELVLDALGMEKVTEDEKEQNIASKKLINDVLLSINKTQNIEISDLSVKEITVTTSTPNNDKKDFAFMISSANNNVEKNSPNSILQSTYIENVNDDKTLLGNSTIYESAYESFSENKSVNENTTNFQSTNEENSIPLDEEISDDEENEFNYIVYEKEHSDALFLTVSDLSIKEKDSLTKRTRTRWSLESLEKCDKIKSNTLRINFDTINVDKKERIYIVEEDLLQLETHLQKIISSKQHLNEPNLIIFQCVNCSFQFTMENDYKFQRNNQVLPCPACKSIFVAEVNDSKKLEHATRKTKETNKSETEKDSLTLSTALKDSNIQNDEKQNVNEKSNIKESTSHSSIGSAGSLNESSSCSKISNSQSSFDSNQSVAGSSSNERDNFEVTSSTNYYCDSDVEILSNPSQSSIEVLDNGQNYSSRKTSEERRISKIPSLDTIEDNRTNDNFQLNEQLNENTLTADNAGLIDFLRNKIESKTKDGVSDLKNNQNLNIEKKNNLGHVHLTESSSSGSITDSICTAYKKADKGAAYVDNGNTGDSYLNTVLGGLFPSTDILMSRSQKSNIQHCEKYKFSFEDFSYIDHRLKFYFYQSKFVDQENFKWIVKGKIFYNLTGQYFEGILVMSTHKLYLMEITGSEHDDVTKWVKQIFSTKVDCIEFVQLLPYHIGLSINIKGWGAVLLIFQDIIRTDSFLLYLANNPLPSGCDLSYQITDKMMKKFSKIVNDDQLQIFTVLNSCDIEFDKIKSKIISPSGFFATNSLLYLTTSNLSWLACDSNLNIEIESVQQMSNLIQVEYEPISNSYWIYFSDETHDKNEIWKCKFETKENAESCLLSIGNSWEKLFGVPLIN